MRLEKVLAFCKCADVGWQKKAAGKKNKFWVGEGLKIRNIFKDVKSVQTLFCALFLTALHITEKVLAEVREKEELKVQF